MKRIPLFFTKAHIDTYTRRDGTVVPAHEDRRSPADDDAMMHARMVNRHSAAGNSSAVHESAMSASRSAGRLAPSDKRHAAAHDAAMLANQVALESHQSGKIRLTAEQIRNIRDNIRDHKGILEAAKKMRR